MHILHCKDIHCPSKINCLLGSNFFPVVVNEFVLNAEKVIFSLSLQWFNTRQHYNNSQYYYTIFIYKIHLEVPY